MISQTSTKSSSGSSVGNGSTPTPSIKEDPLYKSITFRNEIKLVDETELLEKDKMLMDVIKKSNSNIQIANATRELGAKMKKKK